jgi:hypothetical protein
MKTLALIPVLALTACAGAAPIDLCKGAALRRQVYTSAILAADVYAAAGRPVPQSVVLGRQAAVTALAVLDGNCPVVP